VVHRVQAAREERYASLRGYFHGISDVGDDAEMARLHTVTLPEGAGAVGRPLAEVDTEGAEVTAIRRGRNRLDITPATLLAAGDVIVLRGSAQVVARAEALLLG
jgi:CPA2 family monovalent cation:H+ antiporter-2